MNAADLAALLKKHPISVACAVVSIACGVILYLRGDKIGELQTLSEQKAAEAAATLANVRNSEKLGEQAAAMKAATDELDNRLMRAGGLAVNLQYFYRLEADTGVKLMDVRQGGVRPVAKNSSFLGVPYNVSVQGTYPQVITFLSRLQNGTHVCRFLTAGFGKSGEDKVVLSLSLEILGQQ